jgi:hypothetical protein
VQIELNYFVFAPENINNNLSELLNENFSEYLKFTPFTGNKNVFLVENNEGAASNCLLNKIGFLKIGKDLIASSGIPEK